MTSSRTRKEKQIGEIKTWTEENLGRRSDIFEHRLEASDKLRKEGNDFFKDEDYKQALHRYHAAVWKIDFDMGQLQSLLDKHRFEVNSRKLKVLSNICATTLKRQDY